jgi:hypothetical protein
MSARRVFSLLCLAACAAALVGCGGDTFALDPVANAADKTASSNSSRFTFNASITAGAAGSFSMDGNGIFDGRSKTGWMNMTMTVPPEAQAQLGTNASMELIFDGSDGFVMYMRSGMFPGIAADKWVKVDLEKYADEAGVDLGSLMSTNQADPSQVLGMLKASKQARVTGFETVRGVRTTHYTLRLDLRKLAEDHELGDSIDKVIDLTGMDSFPAEAWIDSQGRVRRIKLTMTLGSQFGAPMTMTMTEDLYDFGVRAEIHPPAEGDVIDLSSLLGR